MKTDFEVCACSVPCIEDLARSILLRPELLNIGAISSDPHENLRDSHQNPKCET